MADAPASVWRSASPTRLALSRFWRAPGVPATLTVLTVLYLSAVLAEFVAPCSYATSRDDTPYHPPNVSFLDHNGRASFRPVVYTMTFTRDANGRRRYERDPGTGFPLRFLVRGEPYRVLGLFSVSWHLFGVQAQDRPGVPPPSVHLLGADYRGRDIFARLVYGARISLTIGLLGVLISFSIGLLVGGISGYLGGLTDDVI